MKVQKSVWIINGFALLHAATAALLHWLGVDDSMVLTLMTMLMTVWLCLVRGYSTEVTAACVILVNVVGFLLGTGGARLLALLHAPYLVSHPVASLLTTEILGWGIVLLTSPFHATADSSAWKSSFKWIISAFVVVIVLRFGFVESFSYFYSSTSDLIGKVVALVSNIPALLVMISANIIYVRAMRRWRTGKNVRLWRFLIFAAFVFLLSAVSAVMAVYDFPFLSRGSRVGLREFTGVFMLALIEDLTVYCLVYLVNYALTANRAKEEARMRAREAQFRYVKLKQQISPHFFFNSLNSLDSLVCAGRTELASEYIHKLAGIYRYMLGRGGEELVPLGDEMTFVGMYVDLMRLRYGRGFVVEIDIAGDLLGRMVVPCSVQLLIENVVKHNVVSEEEPMTVTVTARDGSITVRNPLRLRLTPSSEGGHGLTYVTEIYENLCDRPVVIRDTGGEYVVSLPLI